LRAVIFDIFSLRTGRTVTGRSICGKKAPMNNGLATSLELRAIAAQHLMNVANVDASAILSERHTPIAKPINWLGQVID
jgi:hypothetical protein